MYILPIAIVLIVILLQNRRSSDDAPSYAEYDMARDDSRKKMMQEMDDRTLLQNVKAEAMDMFRQWQQGNLIVVRKPIVKFIMQHYPYSSKYTSADLDVIRKEEFNRLKTEYETKYGTHRNGSLLDYRKWKR